MSYLIINRKRTKLQTDSFTYGNWRQYVAFLGDDTAVCVRYADLPTFAMMIGLVLMSIVLMGFFFAWHGIAVNWPYIIVLGGIGLVLAAPWAIMWFTPWRLLVTVSERMQANENGNYTRSF